MTEHTMQLPEPDHDARLHSERLIRLIRYEIEAAGGSIPFARYMELALYAPGLGYYSAGSTKLGAEGDFVTAPETSPIFAYCLAQQCRQAFDVMDRAEILEFGAGSGILACDLLLELERRGALPACYSIIELSADLRRRQQMLLQERVPHLMARIEWRDRLPHEPINGVVLANEVVDAMPVHRVVGVQGLRELHVCWENGRFAQVPGPLSDPELAVRLAAISGELGADNFSPEYVFEINLAASRWLASLGARLGRGLVLIADYGYPRAEYYHPQRGLGTLRCHYRHRVHDDPLILTGLQDITAHVEFTALAETAIACGLEVAGYTSQAYFLLGGGLLEWEERLQNAPQLERLQLAQQIKRLTLPGEMGEKFKLMALARDMTLALSGFRLRDERGWL